MAMLNNQRVTLEPPFRSGISQPCLNKPGRSARMRSIPGEIPSPWPSAEENEKGMLNGTNANHPLNIQKAIENGDL